MNDHRLITGETERTEAEWAARRERQTERINMICDKCGAEHSLTCCPRCAGMGGQDGGFLTPQDMTKANLAWWYGTETKAERRRELMEVATAIYTHADENRGACLAVEAAKNLIAAVDAEMEKCAVCSYLRDSCEAEEKEKS